MVPPGVGMLARALPASQAEVAARRIRVAADRRADLKTGTALQ